MNIDKSDSIMVVHSTPRAVNAFLTIISFGIFVYAILMIITSEGAQRAVSVVFLLASLSCVLIGMSRFIGERATVFDKSTASVNCTKYRRLIVPERHTIRFSDIRRVLLNYERGGRRQEAGSGVNWIVDLETDDELFRINRVYKHSEALQLANEISEFIGKELVDASMVH